MVARPWLDEPPPGTRIALGFDGSDVSDWTVIGAETIDGFSFTPRYGPNRAPTIWQPLEWDGRIPRPQVHLAVDEIFERFQVSRMYCDPPRWETDVQTWALKHGDERVLEWETYRDRQMFEALEQFLADLTEGRVTQDGCPLTALAMANARKVASSRDRYGIGKPSPMQKIDPTMARVLAHKAAADARAAGWGSEKPKKNARLIVLR